MSCIGTAVRKSLWFARWTSSLSAIGDCVPRLAMAVSKHGFNLDPMAAAKANLILPGADQPLPREDVLGKHVKGDRCTLVVDLTLKDFTNG